MQGEPVEGWLAQRGHVAHTRAAKEVGYSPHMIERAIASGRVRRVRRSWLIGVGCPDAVVAAASIGGRLTCLSAARLTGLWTPDHDDVHIALPPSASRVSGPGRCLHTAAAPIPLARIETVEPVINILFHVARCAPPSDALAVWESALRQQRVDAAELAGIRWRGERAVHLASVASDLSDSGVETRFSRLMASIGIVIRQQVWIDGHPVDALIGERLVVQIDGFAHHSSARDRRRDIRADTRLVLRGYTVLRFDYFQVLFDADHVTSTVLTAIAQCAHLMRPVR